MPYDANSGSRLGKQINLAVISTFDKIKAVAGTAVVTLTTLGTIDTGSQTVNGLIAFSGALLLALGVKPLGPAS